MWNLKNKTNEQTQKPRNRFINMENKLVVAKGEGTGLTAGGCRVSFWDDGNILKLVMTA